MRQIAQIEQWQMGPWPIGLVPTGLWQICVTFPDHRGSSQLWKQSILLPAALGGWFMALVLAPGSTRAHGADFVALRSTGETTDSDVQAGDFDSDGVKIHYVVEGQGEPVILIHGLYASALTNWQFPGIMGELAKHYQVVALDCRGHGQSGKPTEEGAYGVKMVEDVVRLMDHLRIAKARVAGYSMGGMITMKLLTLHPERVSSAVVGGMGWLQDGSALQRL